MNYLKEQIIYLYFLLEIEEKEIIFWLLVTFEGVSVYKTHVVFVVIHTDWKKMILFFYTIQSPPAHQLGSTRSKPYIDYQTASTIQQRQYQVS